MWATHSSKKGREKLQLHHKIFKREIIKSNILRLPLSPALVCASETSLSMSDSRGDSHDSTIAVAWVSWAHWIGIDSMNSIPLGGGLDGTRSGNQSHLHDSRSLPRLNRLTYRIRETPQNCYHPGHQFVTEKKTSHAIVRHAMPLSVWGNCRKNAAKWKTIPNTDGCAARMFSPLSHDFNRFLIIRGNCNTAPSPVCVCVPKC